MTNLIRRFRAPLIAIVALVFSASMVAASQPSSPGASGLANAASHAGKSVPVQAGAGASETDESSETDEASETEDSSDSADNCNVDLNSDLSGLSHGSIVCTAAHMTTPDGYDNHGAWVSHWAKSKGADASAAGKSHKPSH